MKIRNIMNKFMTIVMVMLVTFANQSTMLLLNADDEPQSEVTVTQNGITVVKRASQKYDEVTGEPIIGSYQIEFEITGQDIETVNPICSLILLDVSSSMITPPKGSQEKFNNAKMAVVEYTQTLSNLNPENKYLLTTFSSNNQYAFWDFTKTGNNNHGQNSTYANAWNSNAITWENVSGITTHSNTYLANALYNINSKVNIPEGCIPALVIISDGAAEADDYLGRNGLFNIGNGYNHDNVCEAGYMTHNGQDVCDNNNHIRVPLAGKDTQLLTSIKNKWQNIFAIVYALHAGSSDPHEETEAREILKNIVLQEDHFMSADVAGEENGIINKMTDIATTVSALAEGASLVEVPNSQAFTLSHGSGTYALPPLTSEPVHVYYDIEIDQSLPTGIYPTNDVTETKIYDADGNVLVDVNKSPTIKWVKPEYNVYYHYEQLESENGTLYNDGKYYNEVQDDRGPFTGVINEQVDITNYKAYGLNLQEGYSYVSYTQTPTKLTILEDENDENRIDIYYVLNDYEYQIRYLYDETGTCVEDETLRITDDAKYGTLIDYRDFQDQSKPKFVLGSVTPESGTITVGTDENANIINVCYKKVYDLKIEKQVKKFNEDTVLDPSDSFNFEIKFTKDNTNISGEYDYKLNGELQNDKLVFTNGIANKSLRSTDYIEILNIDRGITYTITETTKEGYVVEVKDLNTDLQATNVFTSTISDDNTVTFVNTYGCRLTETGSFGGLMLMAAALFFFGAPVFYKVYNFDLDRRYRLASK